MLIRQPYHGSHDLKIAMACRGVTPEITWNTGLLNSSLQACECLENLLLIPPGPRLQRSHDRQAFGCVVGLLLLGVPSADSTQRYNISLVSRADPMERMLRCCCMATEPPEQLSAVPTRAGQLSLHRASPAAADIDQPELQGEAARCHSPSSTAAAPLLQPSAACRDSRAAEVLRWSTSQS